MYGKVVEGMIIALDCKVGVVDAREDLDLAHFAIIPNERLRPSLRRTFCYG